MMNDNLIIAVFVIFLGVAGFAITIGLMYKENQRIYQKCLANNGTMAYNDAVQYCKEIVK